MAWTSPISLLSAATLLALVATLLLRIEVARAAVAGVLTSPSPEVGRSVAAPALGGDEARTVALACSSRPDYQLSTSMQLDGRLLVIVSPGPTGSAINSLKFGDPRPLTNARIDIGNLVGQTGTFTYQLPQGTFQIGFTIRPVGQSTGPVTVPLTINNQCGSWRTFVGGGAGVPFGGSITGQVTNACSGQPVNGARVAVKGIELPVITGADGRYELFGPQGRQTVEVSAAGFLAGVGEVTIPRGGTVNQPLTLDEATATISGHVTLAGSQPVQGVGGATIQVQGTTLQASSLFNDGRFTIDNVPKGQRTLVTTTSGMVPDSRVVNVCPAVTTVEIGLTLAVGNVTGTVLDVCGRPGQRIVVSHVEGVEKVLANTAGQFSFTAIRSGTQTFRAETGANDGFVATQKAVTVPVNGTATLAMTISGGRGTLQATVVDASGFGVNGATVRIQETGQTATTGPTGTVTIDSVPPGQNGDGAALTMIASKSGVASDVVSFRICPGQTTSATAQLIPNFGLVRATVLQACNDTPLNGAVTTVQGFTLTGTADPTGAVEIADVPSGVQTIVTGKQNFTNDNRSVTVPNGSAVNAGVIKLAGGRATITGFVKSSAGAPIQNATVELRNVANATTFTSPAGQFTLSNIPANTATTGYVLTVSAQSQGYSDLVRTSERFCDGTTNVGTLTLQTIVTTGTLTGVVRHCVTGDPIQGATATVTSTTGFSAPTGADGRFTISNVPAQTVIVEATKSSFGTAKTGNVELAAGATVDVGTLTLCPIERFNQIRAVLTWGSASTQPTDLDLHASFPYAPATPNRSVVWFRFPEFNTCQVSLDPVDDRNFDGGGPEVVTLRPRFTFETQCSGQDWTAGSYHFWVHNYRRDVLGETPNFLNSGARLTIMRDQDVLQTFDVGGTPGDPNKYIWYVCDLEIDNRGNITQIKDQRRFIDGHMHDEF
ncbi:MAG: carboxypeptidase regulatory-like domain-containing protein [Chloroflexota bacterium]